MVSYNSNLFQLRSAFYWNIVNNLSTRLIRNLKSFAHFSSAMAEQIMIFNN